LGENSSLADEMRGAQENLRLSASQLGKLQNEFKSVCIEYDEIKKKNVEYETTIKRYTAEGENKVKILTQECERLNSVVEKKNSEIRALGGEVQEYQENLRLSAVQAQRLGTELNEFKNRLGSTTQESESYKQRIQKLLGENTSLGDEVRTAQENLRLSAGQIGKLQNEFKSVCVENDELRKKLGEFEGGFKRLNA
jgi:chromosome segregation ATPase